MLFVNVYVVKELHHFFGHDHSHEIACDAHDTNEHFHDGTLDWEDCLICHFQTIPAEKTEITALSSWSIPSFTSPIVGQQLVFFNTNTSTYPLRGPPSGLLF